MLIPFKLARNFLALLNCHYFCTFSAIKNRVVSDLECSLRWAVTQQFLLYPCTIKIWEEFISSVFQLLELGIWNTVGNMGNDFWVKVTETNLAAINNLWEVFKEVLVPDLFVYPFDLQEVACDKLVQTVFICDLKELFIYSEFPFSWWHLFHWWCISFWFLEFLCVVSLNFNNIDQPVKSIRITVHSNLYTLSFLDLWDNLRKMRDCILVFLKPFSFKVNFLKHIFLWFRLTICFIRFLLLTLVITWWLPQKNFDILEVKSLGWTLLWSFSVLGFSWLWKLKSSWIWGLLCLTWLLLRQNILSKMLVLQRVDGCWRHSIWCMRWFGLGHLQLCWFQPWHVLQWGTLASDIPLVLCTWCLNMVWICRDGLLRADGLLDWVVGSQCLF